MFGSNKILRKEKKGNAKENDFRMIGFIMKNTKDNEI